MNANRSTDMALRAAMQTRPRVEHGGDSVLSLIVMSLIAAYGSPASSCDTHFLRGRYAQAEACYRDTLPGGGWPIETVIRLGLTLHKENRLAEAESLFQRALEFEESATNLNNMATVYRDEGRQADAEQMLRRALAKSQLEDGVLSWQTALILNNLGLVLWDRGEIARAEPVLRRAASLAETELGHQHLAAAQITNNLAALYRVTGQLNLAAPLVERALWAIESELGPDHPDLVAPLNNLAALELARREYGKAEVALDRAQVLIAQSLSPDDAQTAVAWSIRGALEEQRGRMPQAAEAFRRAVEIEEVNVGAENPALWQFLVNYLRVLKRVRDKNGAKGVQARIRAMNR